ncbi:myb-related transcription factor, partner of profilin-like [Erpetoichthys calabaricus]|uniref:myb-related transcription factor, partner of profilin-like n=1 Tax=Erpetoichthys calabaricus TaxID=27687 RepID=UPI00109FF953|nr:myb-related transcription factor, partner of profilin-like [Erpetoichthys calabaricus]
MQPRERMRKHKFTEAELDILIEEVTQKEDILFGLQGNCMTTYEKNKIWVEIAHRLYAASGMQRTVSEIKRRWQDLKRRTKQKVEDARCHMSKSSPSSALYLTAMEQRVYDSLNIHTVVKEEEQDSAHLPTCEGTFSCQDALSPVICEKLPEAQSSSLQLHQSEETSQVPPLSKPASYTEQFPCMPYANHDIKTVNQECSQISSQNVPESESSLSVVNDICDAPLPSFPGLRSPRKIHSISNPNRIVSVGHFEQQLLRAHREHTAVLKEGFRTLTRQNRLIYREMCETNKNIARIASRIAEKNESVSELAEELVGIHQKITESIDATNCLQDRVIDLLAAQQERPIIVVPSSVHGSLVSSSSSADILATSMHREQGK